MEIRSIMESSDPYFSQGKFDGDVARISSDFVFVLEEFKKIKSKLIYSGK